MNTSASFLLLSDGHLLVPADQVTTLLRRLTDQWTQSAETAGSDLDPATVLALTEALRQTADKIDAECIALMPLTDGGAPPPS
ncbi:DUF6213 family protein [Streptomyces sp. NPDC055103]